LVATLEDVTIFNMGAYVFNDEIFDSWLNKKSDDILSKVDRETITTEEMIILVLKAQTNHFHHTDIDMKKGLADLDAKIERLDQKFEKRFTTIDGRFIDIDARFGKMDEKFEKKFTELDHKIDNRFMWMIGITVAMSGGIYLKLFLG